MSDFRNEWRGALADVQENGAIVSFSAAAGDVISGYAMQIEGDRRIYETFGLTESNPVTLFFVPTTYGVLPSLLNRTVTWAGQAYTVKAVTQTAPDGNCIAAHVYVIR